MCVCVCVCVCVEESVSPFCRVEDSTFRHVIKSRVIMARDQLRRYVTNRMISCSARD